MIIDNCAFLQTSPHFQPSHNPESTRIPRTLLFRTLNPQRRNLTVDKLQTTGLPSDANKSSMREKGKKPLIPRNFVPPSNTVSAWVKLFPFSLPRALQCLISTLRPCLLPCFWIRLDWHKCDWGKFAVGSLLAKGKETKSKKNRGKKKPSQRKGREHHKGI